MKKTDHEENAGVLSGGEGALPDSVPRPPEECEFTALIKTKTGRYVQQQYRDVVSFREEMQEIVNGVAWGALLRRDSGSSVELFSPGKRQKIGPTDSEPKSAEATPEGLTALQTALREAIIKQFKSNKVKAYIATQVKYVNTSRQIGEGIRFLFDAGGKPSANARLEEIVAERERTEVQFRWLDALCAEMRNNLTKLKELEDSALELLQHDTR
ncbi:MAG: hypothetical protein U0411_01760 [Thermodesulfovibrionales bacterium]